MATPEEIELFLRERFAQEIGVALERVDANAPMVSFGLDSVATAGIAGELEDWLKLKLDLMVLYENPSIKAMAIHLAAMTPPTG